jgi:hypothetical protein
VKLVVLEDADSDVRRAALHYDGLQSGLGDRFLDEVERIYGRLESDTPFVIARFRTYRERTIRRLFLRRFPYRVFFVDDPDVRIVIGVPHDRQRAFWLKRVPRR